MSEFSETVRRVLIPMFYKESQIARSIGKDNKNFKKKLFNAIIELSEKADKGTLKNSDIRKKIKECAKTGVSFGQAQKVINVYLKYYCILTNKSRRIIKELDCPLDSKIMSNLKTKNLRKVSLRDMKSFDGYIKWQNHLKSNGRGIRLREDIKHYDEKRIEQFLS